MLCQIKTECNAVDHIDENFSFDSILSAISRLPSISITNLASMTLFMR